MRFIQCRNCFHLTPVGVDVCEGCGRIMNEESNTAPALIFFKEGWQPHIAAEPIYVKSRKELKRVCAEHGCISDYAEM